MNKKAENLFRELIQTDVENNFIGGHIFEHAQLRTTFMNIFMQGPLLRKYDRQILGQADIRVVRHWFDKLKKHIGQQDVQLAS